MSTSELLDALWGELPPPSATKTLQNYVSGLRKTLPTGTIETAAGGYRLVSSAEVDVVRFEALLADASASAAGNPRRAAGLLEEALGLWRGDPLFELSDQPVGVAEATRLVELRRMAVEDLFEARLRLGEHQALVGDLDAAVAAEPLREEALGTAHARSVSVRPSGGCPSGLSASSGRAGRGGGVGT